MEVNFIGEFMEIDFIKTELQKFNVADAVIAKMSAEYLPLKVKGLDDREGLKKVHDARMIVRDKRIEVEKKRKGLKESSLRFGQAVDGEAKRITGLLLPIEAHLENEESIVEKEKERLRLEVEQKEQEKARIAEQERLAEIERQRKAEEEKMALIRKELDMERERQAEIARQQTEAQNKIIAERKKIEDEKRLIVEAKLKEEQEKKLLVDLEKARKEAAEKARIETENRIKREAEAKLEAERQAEIEAKRKEALKPDKEKLLVFAATLTALKMPELLNQQATNIANRATIALMKIVEFIQSESNKL